MKPRAIFPWLCLLALLVFSCTVAVRAQPDDGDTPAVSTVRLKLNGQTLVITSHEQGTNYEVDGSTLKAVSPNSSMTFSLVNGKVVIGSGDVRMESSEVRITRAGRTAFLGRVEGGRVTSPPPVPSPTPEASEEPFAETEEPAPAPVSVQPKPPEAPTFRVQSAAKQ